MNVLNTDNIKRDIFALSETEVGVWSRLGALKQEKTDRPVKMPQRSQFLSLAVLLADSRHPQLGEWAESEDESDNWAMRSNCLGIDVELLLPYNPDLVHDAQQICGGCQVQEPCAEFMVKHSVKLDKFIELPDCERQAVLSAVRGTPYEYQGLDNPQLATMLKAQQFAGADV